MKKIVRVVLLGVAVLIPSLVAIPSLVPLDHLKPGVEAVLSRAIERRISIGALRAEIIPVPALKASNISMLSGRSAGGELFIHQMKIKPDLFKLLKGVFHIRHIQLTGVATNQAFIAGYASRITAARSSTASSPPFAIDQLSGTLMTVRRRNGTRLGPFAFDIRLGPGLRLHSLAASRMDNALKLVLHPEGNTYLTEVKAHHWSVPMEPAIHIDELAATGVLHGGGFELTAMTARAYRGNVHGTAKLSWQEGWRCQAHVTAHSMRMGPIIREWGGRGFTGRFSGDLNITFKGQRPGQLFTDPVIDGTFGITKGAVVPAGTTSPLLVFDRLAAIGHLRHGRLSARHAVVNAYGGDTKGDATLSWAHGWQAKGRLEATNIDLEGLLTGFLEEKAVTGTFTGQADVALAAAEFADLWNNPSVEGAFTVTTGSVYHPGQDKPVFSFDRLTSQALVRQRRLVSSTTRMTAYGGVFTGQPVISWRRGWRIEAPLAATSVDVEPLLEDLYNRKVISGSFQGKADVTLSANAFGSLLDSPRLSGRFTLSDGVIFQADLEKASTEPSRTGTTGGETPFRILSARTHISDGTIRLSDLNITSSALAARGDLDISNAGELNGSLNIALRKTASLISIPIRVHGTSSAPTLRPTRASLIGGAVGTGLLGPGVGTALGIKAGALLEKIGSVITHKKNGESGQSVHDFQ